MTPNPTGTEDTGRWGAGWPKVAFVTWHADDQVLEAAASSAKDRYSVKVVPLDAAHSEIERLRLALWPILERAELACVHLGIAEVTDGEIRLNNSEDMAEIAAALVDFRSALQEGEGDG